MKKIFTYILVVTSLLSLFSCIQREDVSIEDVKVDMVFSATVSDGHMTKTVIDGELGDSYRNTLWLPEDSIAIMGKNRAYVYKFVNIRTEADEVGIFDGSSSQNSVYYALYPYSADARNTNNVFRVYIPSQQKYTPGSFASGAAPMVAKTANGEEGMLSFKNLCGVLVLKLTGEECVSSITFSSKNEAGNWNKISDEWMVDMTYDSIPELVTTDNSGLAVTVYSEEGVQLKPDEPTPFYMVLPPSNHHSFVLTVTTTDGKVMIKEGTKPLNIKRANVTVAAPLVYTESVSVDLSAKGTANCYIVSEPGVYSIDASVMGNGVLGIIEDAGFHTDNPCITGSAAELLWSDKASVVAGVSYSKENNSIIFSTLGVEGNAVVALKDEDGTILWSWHIWCTDEPQVQTYKNSAGTFYVLDRNLGATSTHFIDAEASEDYKGTLYFWGRKDPFTSQVHTSSEQRHLSMDYTISNPTQTHSASSWSSSESWMAPHINQAWSDQIKTIYDPCPIGYRVAITDIWSGFITTSGLYDTRDLNEMNVESMDENGWTFYLDEEKTTTSWYPFSRHHLFTWAGSYGIGWSNVLSGYWASNLTTNGEKRGMRFNKVSDENIELNTAVYTYNSQGFFVRCMRDDAEYPGTPRVLTVGVDSITKTSAIVRSKVLYEGETAVTERGIVWGMDDNISIETGNVIKNDETSDEYIIAIESLQHSTTYYVRAYAVNSEGVSYGAVVSFTTEYDGVAEDLSVYGTANSYIIPAAGVYKFKAVKGNSDELLEGAVSADILWTTFGTTDIPRSGEIVTKVSYSDGYLTLFVPSPLKEGNALVAVKNAEGTILWSWHIWLVNFDPDATAQTYQSGAVMMDRNLGATSVQDQDPKAYGLLYQWGRKDPSVGAGELDQSIFAQTYPADIIQYKWESGSLEYSIQNPTVVIGGSTWNIDNTLWTSAKTIYDPCPIGWRVPDGGPGVWDGWENPTKSLSNGVIFGAPYSVPDAYYPQGGYDDGSHYLSFVGRASYNWSCTPVDSSDYAYNFHFYSGYGRPMDTRNRYLQYNVRCQKDIEYEKESLPEVVIITSSDVTTTSATVSCEVKSSGYEDVNDRGVVYGIDPNPTLETGIRIQSGSGVGQYTVSLTSLEPATRYYVKAYATSSVGTSYSEEARITTANDGTYRDLSVAGTANSYIVPSYGYYSFDATVKGNGMETIDGTPVSAEVVWETQNTVDAIAVGDVIDNVTFKDGRVLFNTSEDFNHGNALVAVKDSEGTILWSWHLWVTDYDPESTYHNYPSGAVMMDRNLGALSNGTDVISNGLLYQWGRKDPFMGAGDNGANPAATAPLDAIRYETISEEKGTLLYVMENPAALIYNPDGLDWLIEPISDLWSEDKSVYDPCPAGWQVPSSNIDIWRNARGNFPSNNYTVDGYGIEFGDDYWTSGGRGRSWGSSRPHQRPLNVRCMKESQMLVSTLSYTSGAKSANVVGKVISLGSEEIKECGVVFSRISTPDMYITRESDDIWILRNTSGGDEFGDFEVEVDNLQPNTQYYARAYVISERGISYGETISVFTKSSGNNEGIGDDDYEW